MIFNGALGDGPGEGGKEGYKVPIRDPTAPAVTDGEFVRLAGDGHVAGVEAFVEDEKNEGRVDEPRDGEVSCGSGVVECVEGWLTDESRITRWLKGGGVCERWVVGLVVGNREGYRTTVRTNCFDLTLMCVFTRLGATSLMVLRARVASRWSATAEGCADVNCKTVVARPESHP